MAMSNAQRQKRWKEKHRALYNLQRRNRRKGLKEERETPLTREVQHEETGPATKIDALRALVAAEQSKPAVEAPAKPQVFYNDFGVKIPEEAWNKLQDLKRKAEETGYHRDEFSQD